MKIKRFFSSDMRNVIRLVREELGPDAVILSNSRVNGGVEVVAAVDYDESIFNKSGNDSDTRTDSERKQMLDDEIANSSELKPVRQKVLTPQQKAKKEKADGIVETSATPDYVQSSSYQKLKDQGSQPSLTTSEEEYAVKKKESDFSFHLLGDGHKGDRVEDTLFDTASADQFSYPDSVSANTVDTENTIESKSSVWSQEPTLVGMRHEISGLRNLLEKQLSGLAWGDFARNNPVRAKLLRQLLELDLSPALAGKVAESISDYSDYDKSWQYGLRLLGNLLPTNHDDLVASGGIISLVGPTGVGKTTTIAKLAARYALRHGRNNVALITTDSYRIAAHEQLKTYGRILGMPVRVASNQEELVEALNGFADKDLVLVDTAGMSHRDARMLDQYNMILDSAPEVKSLLVLSTTTHRAGLDEIVRVFNDVDLDGCVITKTDETTSLAGALSVAIEHQLPITYVGNGQKVPEDLHLARANSLVNQSVLIARKTNQPLENESLELAFSRVTSNAYV